MHRALGHFPVLVLGILMLPGCQRNEPPASARDPSSADKMPPSQEGVSLDQKLINLRAVYEKNAITDVEWAKLKQQVIEQIPETAPAGDTRSLGQKLIDLRQAYDKNAITDVEWAKAKGRLIKQMPAPSDQKQALSVDQQLIDLRKAYDKNAITDVEWSNAKAELIRRSK